MTRVGFYVLASRDPDARLTVAARLASKAFEQGNRVFINAQDETQAHQLDGLLWSFRTDSFLPHNLHGQEPSEAVCIGWGQEPNDQRQLLINLQWGVAPFFSRFERVAEVVTQDAGSLTASRDAWTYYRDRGYQLEKHDL
ncbi:MAG: DNA polymerase III subunit chi [Pseudomonadota bacterium]